MRNFWKVLKNRLINEENQTVSNCNQFKMQIVVNKMRWTDVTDTEQLDAYSDTWVMTYKINAGFC